MKSYGQFGPVAKACEIVAERWTPLVLREASTPRARGHGREYRLTPAGEEVRSVIMGLGEWGQRWARREIAPDDLDAELLAWDMHRRLNVDRLPARRVVVRFDLRGVPRHQPGRKTWWLVLTRPEVDLCVKDPGFEVDLTVDADLAALTPVWMGDMRLQDALREGLIRPDGPRELVRASPTWFGLSLFAGVERPAVVSAPHAPGRGPAGGSRRQARRQLSWGTGQ